MASSPLLRQRVVIPAATVLLATAATLTPKRSVYAEEPMEAMSRKPIYDDTPLATLPLQPTAPHTLNPRSELATPPSSTHPSPTDRLAAQLGKTRMYLHKYAVKAEDGVNNFMTSALNLEHSFTSTLYSLKPPRETGERIMPNALYVLVSAMAGSIMTRRSNILLRATLPFAAGLGAANYLLPLTTHNVGQLVWRYEQRVPVIAENHERIQERVTRFWETSKAHSAMGVQMLTDKTKEARESAEEWVRKGR